MESVAVQFLFFLNLIFAVERLPRDLTNFWNIGQDWERYEYGYRLSVNSSKIVDICKENPTKEIIFPRVVHSAQRLYLDGQLYESFGDSTFSRAAPFYKQLVLPCSKLTGKSSVDWIAESNTQYFARISVSPKLVQNSKLRTFFNAEANLIAAGSIFILSLFGLFIYFGRVDSTKLYFVSAAGLFASIYFANTVNADLGMQISMVASHRIADISLWLSILCYFYFYFKDNLISKMVFLFQAMSVCFAILVIATGKSSDEVQFGTTIPMIPFLISSIYSIWRLSLRFLKQGVTNTDFAKFSSVVVFSITGQNDILNMFGLIDTTLISPFGATAAFFGLAVAVNQNITAIYAEREKLMNHLELAVAEKTEHLTTALEQVKKSQAELVQSARLASLGTLSAGIAHEINNAINFVNGAILPLEKRVIKYVPEADRPLVDKLFAAIKEGTGLTVEIVRSLRNFTGLNQAKVKEVKLKAVVESVITILRSKVSAAGIDVKVNIDEQLTLECHQVGLNQIIMNLMVNSIDAMKTAGGLITISGGALPHDKVFLTIKDNGSGIPQDILNRIFDPFFTTKEVGKGTGLGLHIVQKETERHNGKIEVQSEVGKGTAFTITLPKFVSHNVTAEAA